MNKPMLGVLPGAGRFIFGILTIISLIWIWHYGADHTSQIVTACFIVPWVLCVMYYAGFKKKSQQMQKRYGKLK